MIILFSELIRKNKSNALSGSTEYFNSVNISLILSYIQKNYRTATLESTSKAFDIDTSYMTKILKNFLNKSH